MSSPTSKSPKPHGALRAAFHSGKWREIGTTPLEDVKQPSSSPSWYAAPAMNISTVIRNGELLVLCYGADGIPRLLQKKKLRYWL
jgi:hypothetical protein